MSAPQLQRDPGLEPVRIAIAVAVHNRRDVTLAWLASVAAADRRGLDVHLVLADDGSTDGTADAVLDAWPSAEVLRTDGHQFYARGTNLAIARALAGRPDFVLVSNDDTVLEPDSLQRLVACARAHPRSIVGPVLVHDDDPGRVFQTYPRWHTRYGGWRHRQHLRTDALPREPLEVEVIVGNCILVPAAAIAEGGLLDDRGIHNWVGDAEWTPRLARAGWQLLVEPSARVRCLPNPVVPSPWTGGARSVLAALTDPLSPYSWRAMWANRTVSGPDPARGALAFAVHVARLGLRRAHRGDWPDWPDEPVPGPGARPIRAIGPAPAADRPGDTTTTVVLVWPYLTWGGAQTHLIGIADHLGPSFRCRALVPEGTDAALVRLLTDHDVEVDTYGPAIDLGPAPTLGAKIARRAHDARVHVAIARAAARFDPATTVLHVDLAPWSSAALLLALSRRFEVFQTLHTAPPTLSPLRRRVWRAKLELVRARRGCHLTLGNRDAGLGFDRLLGRGLGAALTPTAVDVALAEEARASLDRGAEREGLGVPPGARLLVGVGQLIDRKGIDVAVDALAGCSGPPAVLRWFGSGEAGDELQARAERLGVADQVAFVAPSRVPTRIDLFRAVAAADVYLQPSREEGLPLALVEAVALGVPVVATAVNGIPEVVEHDVTGLLVPPDDAGALAAAIDRLLDDPELGRRLARAAADRIRPDHDLATTGATMAQLYRRALERRLTARALVGR